MWWLIGLAAVLLAVACALAMGCMQTRRVRMQAFRYEDPAVPPPFCGFRIAQISDYHDSPYPGHGAAMLDAVRAQKPDLIVLTGDQFNRRREDGCEHTFAMVSGALKIAPVFVVEGNHECRLARYPQWRRRLTQLGAVVLEDAAVDLFRNGRRIRIVGMRQVFDTDTLRRLCSGSEWSLVLSHRCECVSQYAAAGNALVLSGHAHGGQIRVFGRAVYAPEQGLLPRHTEGACRTGGATLYVSRGIGNTICVPRIADTPEWNLIVLSDGSDRGR